MGSIWYNIKNSIFKVYVCSRKSTATMEFSILPKAKRLKILFLAILFKEKDLALAIVSVLAG